MTRSPSDILAPLQERREDFVRFLTTRLGGDRAEAEDLLQSRLAKAVTAAPPLRDPSRIVPWFYQVLRRAAVDFIRARQAADLRAQRWALDLEAQTEPDAETRAQLCACLPPLVAQLPARQAALIQRVALGGDSVQDAAAHLGLTANHASVTLHRARTTLRRHLQEFCGACAETHCLDCDCHPLDNLPQYSERPV